MYVSKDKYLCKFLKNCPEYIKNKQTNKQTKTERQQRSLTELLHMYICLSMFIEYKK